MQQSIEMAGEGKLNLPHLEGIPDVLTPAKTFELFVNIERKSLQSLYDIFSEYIIAGKPINQMDPELGMRLAPTMIKSLSEEDSESLGLADREHHPNAYYNLAFETYIKANTSGFMDALRGLEQGIQSVSKSLMTGRIKAEDLPQVQKNIDQFGKSEVERYQEKFAPSKPAKEEITEENAPIENETQNEGGNEDVQKETVPDNQVNEGGNVEQDNGEINQKNEEENPITEQKNDDEDNISDMGN